MHLFSTTYKINQHGLKRPNLRQKTQNWPNPISLLHLRRVRGLDGARGSVGKRVPTRLPEIQRNKLGLIGPAEDRSRKKPPQKHSSSAEGEPRRKRQRAHDNA